MIIINTQYLGLKKEMSFNFNFGNGGNNANNTGGSGGFGGGNTGGGFGTGNTGGGFSGGNTGGGFGTGNTGGGFGGGNTGGGFGTGNTGGFGTGNTGGFGAGNTSGGMNSGFGGSTGFNLNNQNTQSTSSFNFNNTSQNSNPSGGFGFGQNNNNTNASSFGQNNPNQGTNFSNFNTEDYKKDVQLDSSVNLPDTISQIKWINPMNGDCPPIFAATCWDKTVRIFSVTQGQTGQTITQSSMATLPYPATCLTWNPDNSILYAGCIDGSIRSIDTKTMNSTQVGKHNAGISSVHYVQGANLLISTAYQNQVKFWQGNPNPVMSLNVQNKVFVADCKNNVLAGATLGEKLFYTDMQMASSGSKTILDSTDLGKYSQIQSLSLDPKGENVGLTTIDGRSNISSLTKTSHGFKTHPLITFKSNKVQEQGNVILYPTNTSCFNPCIECWFLTGGSDGTLSYWDFKARNKIKTFNFHVPVCNAHVSPNGKMVAYSLGNDWHIGPQGIGKWPNLIGVHFITDQQQKFSGVSQKR